MAGLTASNSQQFTIISNSIVDITNSGRTISQHPFYGAITGALTSALTGDFNISFVDESTWTVTANEGFLGIIITNEAGTTHLVGGYNFAVERCDYPEYTGPLRRTGNPYGYAAVSNTPATYSIVRSGSTITCSMTVEAIITTVNLSIATNPVRLGVYYVQSSSASVRTKRLSGWTGYDLIEGGESEEEITLDTPTNFIVTKSVDSTYVTIEWSDVANNAGYRIERKSDTDADFTLLVNVGPDITEIEDHTVDLDNHYYFYRIKATA